MNLNIGKSALTVTLPEKHHLLKEDKTLFLDEKKKKDVRVPLPIRYKPVVRNNNFDVEFWISAKRRARKKTKSSKKPLEVPELNLKPEKVFLTRKQTVNFLFVHNYINRKSNEATESLIIPTLSLQASNTKLSKLDSLPMTERNKDATQRSEIRLQSCNKSDSGTEPPNKNSQNHVVAAQVETIAQETLSPRRKMIFKLPIKEIVKTKAVDLSTPSRALTDRNPKFNPLSVRSLFSVDNSSPSSPLKPQSIVTLRQSKLLGMDFCNQQRVERILNSEKNPLQPKFEVSSPTKRKKDLSDTNETERLNDQQYQIEEAKKEKILSLKESEETKKCLRKEAIRKALRESNLIVDELPINLEELENLAQVASVRELDHQEMKARYRYLQQIRAKSMDLIKNHQEMIRKNKEESYLPKLEFKLHGQVQETHANHEKRNAKKPLDNIAVSDSRRESPTGIGLTSVVTCSKRDNQKIISEYADLKSSLLSVKHKSLIKNLELKKNKVRAEYRKLGKRAEESSKRAEKLVTSLNI